MAQGNLAGKIASLEMQIKLLKGQAKKKKKVCQNFMGR